MSRRLLVLGAAALLSMFACADEGGGGGKKITLKPFQATGQPLTAEPMTWTWVEFPDTKCRDGSPSGLAVSLNPASTNLMIYLEGGGACFDQFSCLISPDNADVFKAEKTSGLFNRARPENPVKDWSYVYVPYCTGDTHAGDAENVTVPGVSGVSQFVGYANMKKYLNRVVPTFPNVTNVLLTGISAGGFGAAQNALLVQSAFPAVKIKLIDDSGPPLSEAVIPTCLQKKWRELWGLDKTYLADCGDACSDPENFVQDVALAMARTFDDRPAGLIEATRDEIIRRFFGAGLNDCSAAAIVNAVPPETFSADLLQLRELISDYPSFGTWTPDSTQHTWIASDGVFDAQIGGTKLIDWMTRIINGQDPGHYGP